MLLGSVVSELIRMDLYPVRRTGAEITISVDQLKEQLLGLRFTTHESTEWDNIRSNIRLMSTDVAYWSSSDSLAALKKITQKSHAKCARVIDLSKRIELVISNMPSPVLDSHRRHMEEQAKK
jgi:hypothetical protein